MIDSVVGRYDVEVFIIIRLMIVYKHFIPVKDLFLLKNWNNEECV